MSTVDALQAQTGEYYVRLSGVPAVLPALIDADGPAGKVQPRFRRPVAQELLRLLGSQPEGSPLGHVTAVLHGDVLKLSDEHWAWSGVVKPDRDDRFPLGLACFPWRLAAPPIDLDQMKSLLADTARLARQPGEMLVTINVDGTDPQSPALASPGRWSRAGCPRFRPEVAAVVVAWIQNTALKDTDGCAAYWRDQTIVVVDGMYKLEEAFTLELIDPDEDGRYAIGSAFEWEQTDD